MAVGDGVHVVSLTAEQATVCNGNAVGSVYTWAVEQQMAALAGEGGNIPLAETEEPAPRTLGRRMSRGVSLAVDPTVPSTVPSLSSPAVTRSSSTLRRG